VLLLAGATVRAAQPTAERIAFFEKNIRPVLVDVCGKCHDAAKHKGGLRLDARSRLLTGGDTGPAIVPGRPEESLLIQAIRYNDERFRMPPTGKLSDAVIAAFTQWVRDGAVWPESSKTDSSPSDNTKTDRVAWAKHWSYQPLLDAAPPMVADVDWVRTPIDRFILAGLENDGLQPASPASRRTLLRRVTFDLIGLPPTPAEIDAFLADTSPDAFGRVVERLLASPRYGERWGRHWLDVVRYADSNGLDENLAYANAFRYRDYVIDAFNGDKPYDRFIHEQLAGDLLPTPPGETDAQRYERLIATGFLSLGPKMLACDDGRKMELDIVDEQVDTTSRAFMGLTMGCSRCHDHKFDPLTTEDYYGLAGIFKSTKTMENFKVVAVWHEYTLAGDDEQARAKALEAEIVESGKRIEARIAAAQDEFMAPHRAKAGAYLLAASEFVDFGGTIEPDGKTPVGASVRPVDLDGRGVLLEAEAFGRGTLTVDRENWGPKIGVLLQTGFAEYDIELPAAGDYQLELRYAATESRPVVIQVNGKIVTPKGAAELTGGWYPKHQQWHVEGVFAFDAGQNTVRLERVDGPVPHIDKLLLVKMPARTDPATLVPLSAPEGSLVIEAERYARGTAKVVGGIIQNGGDGKFYNEAEYDIELDAAGRYQLDLRYTSGDPRQVRLLINGEVVKPEAATQVTGSFAEKDVTWFAEGIFDLPRGPSTVRIEGVGAIPHIDKLALIPTDRPVTVAVPRSRRTRESIRQVAAKRTLHEEILRQWIAYLKAANKGPGTIWQTWATWTGWAPPDGNSLAELAAAYQKLFDQADAAWRTLRDDASNKDKKTLPDVRAEAFRAVLYDAKGPFRIPAKPERFYSAPAMSDIDRLTRAKVDLEKSRPTFPTAMGVREGKIENLPVHIRGNYLSLGDEVERAVPAVLAGASSPVIDASTSGRLQLTRWLTRPEHPLTARVMVNRIWQWHFGEGLVRTPDNFGRLGQAPTDQRLLDWLARRFIASGWSIKDMHRLILGSSTYRMSAAMNATANEKDPENKRWWRFRRRRLDAEEIRDSILAYGDHLDLAMYGQLMPNKNRAYITGTGSTESAYDYLRRSVYVPIMRSAVYDVFQAFDFADPSVLSGKRASTTVAPQALFMMNGELILRESRRMAEGLLTRYGDDDERVEEAYTRIFGREPVREEVKRSLAFVDRYRAALVDETQDADERRVRAWQGLCRMLIASNEFVFVD
jgi:hypothetical protein